ncbi:histone deacetylase [Kribbella sp. NPDC058245]|uniref:histone deacetylase n=1 Tax=Kribbella sp. NPDC058245 TaxID=3346399 RepID=UPI0036E7E582
MEHVWYVAYGSNLALERFNCYLYGGRPTGGARTYPGCRDHTAPARIEGVEIAGGLLFAGASKVWGGGSAFFDPTAPRRVAGRADLLTPDQLGDVAAQEMWREPGGAFSQDLSALLPDVAELHTMGPGRYETVVRLGEYDGLPMFTVTHGDAAELIPVAPTASYLQWIATGLAEAHGWDAPQIAHYLMGAAGVSEGWTEETLLMLRPGMSAGTEHQGG